MKKVLYFVCACAFIVSLAACAPQAAEAPTAVPAATEPPATAPTEPSAPTAIANPVIRLSTTTSVNDSGLMAYLQPVFEADTGYKLEITSAGTGAAIEKARTGDADALLVHAKASEEEFIGEGFDEERVPFMFNYFVIVGPESDPAGVKDAATAIDAFKAIAALETPFITRGDESGTHKAELKIWSAAEIEPSGDWYINIGGGMGAALTMAGEKTAYTLSDKATYLTNKNGLVILKEESDEMKNTYSMIAVTPARYADTNYDGALAFINWMTSPKALDLIDNYGMQDYGEQLFFAMR